MDKSLQEKIAALPAEPGVYLMKDRAGRVFYVGKAVNLRARVRSYFAGDDPRFFVPLLDRLLAEVDTTVVRNEKEALLLENALIRRHRPRFNLRPKEGRNFIYLRLDPAQRYPRLELTRQVQRDGARYFGPYPLARALRETLRVVNRHFKLRTCADHDPATHQRPCLLCQIGRFPAPSVYDIPPEIYRRHVADAILFLEGRGTDLVDALRRRMEAAASEERYEEAARLRDQLEAVEQTLAPQKVVSAEEVDQDALGLARQGSSLAVYVLHVRHGQVLGGQAFSFAGQSFPEAELLASFLNLYYEEGRFVPDEVLLPVAIEGLEAVEALLAERKGAAVRVLVPRSGTRLELARMSRHNAEAGLKPQAGDIAETLARLRDRLGLKRVPHRMECFDASHFQGATLVASKVAMTDGRPDKDRYRRYRIGSVRVGDDFAALYEAVLRRFRRGLEEGDLPELLVVDGGKGQLASAQAALGDLGISGVEVIALAKGRRRGEAAERLPERIFLPGRKESIVLPRDSPAMLLLARLRDEAHRFAISYQRKLLRREQLRSGLESIAGVGPQRRKFLLRRFASAAAVKRAGVAELAGTEGIGPALAERIYAHFHGGPSGGAPR